MSFSEYTNFTNLCQNYVLMINSHFFKETHNEIKANQDTFLRKFEALNRDEVTAALMCSFKDIEDTLAKEVSCVGCRRSVESKLILTF